MKIRHGFVSNSSSSSFVIPSKSDMDEVIIKVTIGDLMDMINHSYEGGHNIISTEEDLRAYFVKRYAWREKTFDDLMKEEPDLVKNYDEYMALIKDSGSIIVGYIDNGEYNIIDLIRKAGGIVEE